MAFPDSSVGKVPILAPAAGAYVGLVSRHGWAMDIVPDSPRSVLVIDDDELLCQLVVRMLDPAICHAAAVTDAEHGLRIIEAGDPPLDLVLTDLQMPGLDGWDVVEVLTQYCPELPVVVLSGAADAPTTTALAQFGVRALRKPFTYRQLQKLVAPTLAESDTRHPKCRATWAPGVLVTAAWGRHRQRQGQPSSSSVSGKDAVHHAHIPPHRQCRPY